MCHNTVIYCRQELENDSYEIVMATLSKLPLDIQHHVERAVSVLKPALLGPERQF